MSGRPTTTADERPTTNDQRSDTSTSAAVGVPSFGVPSFVVRRWSFVVGRWSAVVVGCWSPRSQRAWRFCFYVLPLLLWMSTIFDFSGGTGSRASTIGRFIAVLTLFWPEAKRALTFDQIDLLFYLVRKAAHITEYCLLTLLALRAMQQERAAWEWRRALLAALIAVAYACTDEWHQSFVVSRTADVKDVFIDSIGVILASVLGWLWYRGKRDTVAQLERLEKLRERGAVTEEEFRLAKERILGRGYTSIHGTRAAGAEAPHESATLRSS